MNKESTCNQVQVKPKKLISLSKFIGPSISIDPRKKYQKKVEHALKKNIKNEFGVSLLKIVFHSNLMIRLFWLPVLVVTLGFSLYLIVYNFQQYFSYSVTTTSEQIFETPTEFPRIILCNQNPITTEYGYNASLNSVYVSALSPSEQKLLGHNMNDTLLFCTFNNLVCTADDFEWTFDQNLGNCYSFNAEKTNR